MRTDWKNRAVAASDIVSVVRSGAQVYLHGARAAPAPLIKALNARHEFRSISLCTSAPLRQAIAEIRADFVPIFLSGIPGLFLDGAVKLHGKSLRERDEAPISIAHPDVCAELARGLAQVRHFPPPSAAE